MRKPTPKEMHARIKKLGTYDLVKAVAAHLDLDLSIASDYQQFLVYMEETSEISTWSHKTSKAWMKKSEGSFFDKHRMLIVEELNVYATEEGTSLLRAVGCLAWPKYQKNYNIGAVLYGGIPEDEKLAADTKEALEWLILTRVAAMIVRLTKTHKYHDKLLNNVGKAEIITWWHLKNKYADVDRRHKVLRQLLDRMEKPVEIITDTKGRLLYYLGGYEVGGPVSVYLSKSHFAE